MDDPPLYTWEPIVGGKVDEERVKAVLDEAIPIKFQVLGLFGYNVPDDELDKVFAAMAYANQHTFVIKPKAPEQLRKYVKTQRSLLNSEFFNVPLGNLINHLSHYMGDPIWVNARGCLWSTEGREVSPGDEDLMSPENPLGFPTYNMRVCLEGQDGGAIALEPTPIAAKCWLRFLKAS